MSSRNDTYLSLCFAQAELSPLQYRHGSIVVRGGKVIGQGFNCYRPGFDGGALKTGVLPSTSLDSIAIPELKRLLKSRSKQENQENEGTVRPFEFIGSGHAANTPLTMHSEIMAIHSALSLSSSTLSSQTSARATTYFQKPCFRLPSDSKKRKAWLSSLKAYAQAVCIAAEPTNTSKSYSGKSSIQKQGFETGTSQSNQLVRGEEQGALFGGGERSIEHKEKYQQSPREKERRNSGPQDGSRFKSASKTELQLSNFKDDNDDISINIPHVKRKSNKNQPSITPNFQPILITKKKDPKSSVTARTKDLRLKGSDLYVARLGRCSITPLSKPSAPPSEVVPPLPSSPKSEPTSLYDELSPLSRSIPPTSSATPNEPPTFQPEIRASRPCYRCVSSMYAVGIKRVFWTNQNGEWEGAKVRDLVEALENGLGGDDEDVSPTGQEEKGIFVTKHEVLILRRTMGF